VVPDLFGVCFAAGIDGGYAEAVGQLLVEECGKATGRRVGSMGCRRIAGRVHRAENGIAHIRGRGEEGEKRR
jgi:hypothetical protein